MDLLELNSIVPHLVEKIEHLEAEVAELKSSQQPQLPEWVTLKQACQWSGSSYSSLRRSEYQDRRPRGGRVISGTTKYPRQAVLEWCEELGR